MNTAELTRYRDMHRDIRALEAQVKEMKAEADSVEQALVEAALTEGIQSVNVDGSTLYLHRQVWPKVEDRPAAVHALRATGYGELVSETFNTNQLGAVIRERLNNGEELPLEWSGAISIVEKTSLRIRGL